MKAADRCTYPHNWDAYVQHTHNQGPALFIPKALNDDVLVTVQFNTGEFFRVELNEHRRRSAAPQITEISG